MSINNFKTKLCKNFEEGFCQFGAECLFAHGEKDIIKQQRSEPCWFFNTDICTNKLCPYEHVIADIRKPLRLQKPCFEFHTAGNCYKDDCRCDHFQLTDEEFSYHFPYMKRGEMSQICQKKEIDTTEYRDYTEKTEKTEDERTETKEIVHIKNGKSIWGYDFDFNIADYPIDSYFVSNSQDKKRTRGKRTKTKREKESEKVENTEKDVEKMIVETLVENIKSAAVQLKHYAKKNPELYNKAIGQLLF